MEEHEQEERELTSGMERSMATAIATAASLVEAYQRRRARDSQNVSPIAQKEAIDLATEQLSVQEDARAELAVRRDDGDLWRSAPYEMLNDQVLRANGIDPRRVGEPGADKEWITRAPGSEILDVYAAADRWAGRSEVAQSVRENIAEELSAYGLDLDELLHQPRGTAAEHIETARAEHWAQRGHDAEGTPAERAEADRDGAHVEQLLEQASAADRTARDTGQTAAELTTQGDSMAQDRVLVGSSGAEATRSELAAEHSSHSPAGRAAAVAATDHPTRPRDAVANAGAAKKAPKVKAARPQTNRERSHGR